MHRLRAHEWAALLLDDGSVDEHLADIRSADPLGWPGYPALRERAEGDEAVRVYSGTLDGHEVALIAFDFAHLGGSMGAGVGGRVAGAFDLARERALPVVTVAATGGSRMQEGMVALSQMPRAVVAARAHARAGLLHLGVASDPTTGGVYASFLSQADLLVTEPGAYVGFAGRRVIEALTGQPVADEVNTAERAHDHGLVDAVIPRDGLWAWLATALASVQPLRCVDETANRPMKSTHPSEAWAQVEAARDQARPRASEYLRHFGDVTRFHGDRTGGTDPGTIAALARLGGRPLGLVALDRHRVQPAGYRTGWRVLDTTGRLGLPVLTLVDTPGADPTDHHGQAHAISHTFVRLLEHPAPTVALVIGEGGSGGALALSAVDRLLIQEGAIFSVIAPEGAAAILHRDRTRAPEVAERLKLTAPDLVDLGIADELVPDDPAAALAAAAAHLDALAGLDPAELVARRQRRWGGT
jgi:acyl-CoA carboxylase subunit beta